MSFHRKEVLGFSIAASIVQSQYGSPIVGSPEMTCRVRSKIPCKHSELEFLVGALSARSTLLRRGATALRLDLGELDFGNSPVVSRTRLISREEGGSEKSDVLLDSKNERN